MMEIRGGFFDGDATVYDRERFTFWETVEEDTRELVMQGYEKARAARFEHGESPGGKQAV